MFSEAPEKLLRPMLIAGTLDLLQLLYPLVNYSIQCQKLAPIAPLVITISSAVIDPPSSLYN